MRYEFYQSQTTITFDIFVRGVIEKESIIKVENDGKVLHLVLVTGSVENNKTPLELSLDLFGTVLDVKDSIMIAYRATKVEVRLTKSPSSLFMWPTAIQTTGSVQVVSSQTTLPTTLPVQNNLSMNTLSSLSSSSLSASSSISSSSASASETSVIPDKTQSYPTSSTKKKDWNAVEREINAEEESEKPQGEEALFKLFRSIYSNANEDTKRAMVKSFQTSGGTVLSTNWEDVSKKDFEKEGVQAPAGMEMKKFEQ